MQLGLITSIMFKGRGESGVLWLRGWRGAFCKCENQRFTLERSDQRRNGGKGGLRVAQWSARPGTLGGPLRLPDMRVGLLVWVDAERCWLLVWGNRTGPAVPLAGVEPRGGSAANIRYIIRCAYATTCQARLIVHLMFAADPLGGTAARGRAGYT